MKLQINSKIAIITVRHRIFSNRDMTKTIFRKEILSGFVVK